MKKITFLTSILFLSTFNLLAQENLSFSKVIQTDSVGKKIIYSTIIEWFGEFYKSAKEVIQVEDKEAGFIIGTGSIKYHSDKLSFACYDGFIRYKIKVTIKDNKYKIELTNISHSSNGGACTLGNLTDAEIYTNSGLSKYAHNKVWIDLKLKISEHINYISSSLEEKSKKMSEVKDSDF